MISIDTDALNTNLPDQDGHLPEGREPGGSSCGTCTKEDERGHGDDDLRHHEGQVDQRESNGARKPRLHPGQGQGRAQPETVGDERRNRGDLQAGDDRRDVGGIVQARAETNRR